MTPTEKCVSCGRGTQPDPLSGEPFCDACFEDMSIGDCLKRLGITPDQLKIARALDREKIKRISYFIEKVPITVNHRKWTSLACEIIEFLPTFPLKEDKP